ncbi:MAG: acyl-CoA thioesterase [Bdellovibrionales bacterium]|nr:acyl-CoA thioesterase [Bdellovibrionales bacterium]
MASPKRNARAKYPEDSAVHTTEFVLPQHTNQLGAIFGGVLMSWIDICAAIAASRHSGRTCVTASIDQLNFLRPIRKGYVVNLAARVTAVHTTSCEVMVEVQGENVISGECFHTAKAFLTFVALDEEGRPTPMPPLTPRNAHDRVLIEQAKLRRKHRIKLKKVVDAAER